MSKKTSRQSKEKISPNILKIVFSEKTPFQISKICIENGIEGEEKIEQVAHYTGLVLLGKLTLKEFQKTLEEKVEIDPETAEKINQEISETILSTIKSNVKKPEVKIKTHPKKDTYRELVE